MMSALRAAVVGRPSLVVDVSNLRRRQLMELNREPGGIVLVSTHKSFNARAKMGDLPPFAVGTRWLVLCVPHVREDGHVHRSHFDGELFRHRRATSPVRLHYEGRKKCSISEGKRRTSREHRWCEIDDHAIFELSRRLGADVASNDRALGRDVTHGVGHPPSAAMDRLMTHTRITVLQWTPSGWARAGYENAQKNRRSIIKGK